jgi:hypothetical protein
MNKERLLKLAKHLASGQLGHDHFDIGCFNEGGTKENPCGSAGCAIGECPIVFPKSWYFRELAHVGYGPRLLKSDKSGGPFGDAMAFFGISWGDASLLFGYRGPGCTCETDEVHESIRYNRDNILVAAEIRAFVKHDGDAVATLQEVWPDESRSESWMAWFEKELTLAS